MNAKGNQKHKATPRFSQYSIGMGFEAQNQPQLPVLKELTEEEDFCSIKKSDAKNSRSKQSREVRKDAPQQPQYGEESSLPSNSDSEKSQDDPSLLNLEQCLSKTEEENREEKQEKNRDKNLDLALKQKEELRQLKGQLSVPVEAGEALENVYGYSWNQTERKFYPVRGIESNGKTEQIGRIPAPSFIVKNTNKTKNQKKEKLPINPNARRRRSLFTSSQTTLNNKTPLVLSRGSSINPKNQQRGQAQYANLNGVKSFGTLNHGYRLDVDPFPSTERLLASRRFLNENFSGVSNLRENREKGFESCNEFNLKEGGKTQKQTKNKKRKKKLKSKKKKRRKEGHTNDPEAILKELEDELKEYESIHQKSQNPYLTKNERKSLIFGLFCFLLLPFPPISFAFAIFAMYYSFQSKYDPIERYKSLKETLKFKIENLNENLTKEGLGWLEVAVGIRLVKAPFTASKKDLAILSTSNPYSKNQKQLKLREGKAKEEDEEEKEGGTASAEGSEDEENNSLINKFLKVPTRIAKVHDLEKLGGGDFGLSFLDNQIGLWLIKGLSPEVVKDDDYIDDFDGMDDYHGRGTVRDLKKSIFESEFEEESRDNGWLKEGKKIKNPRKTESTEATPHNFRRARHLAAKGKNVFNFRHQSQSRLQSFMYVRKRQQNDKAEGMMLQRAGSKIEQDRVPSRRLTRNLTSKNVDKIFRKKEEFKAEEKAKKILERQEELHQQKVFFKSRFFVLLNVYFVILSEKAYTRKMRLIQLQREESEIDRKLKEYGWSPSQEDLEKSGQNEQPQLKKSNTLDSILQRSEIHNENRFYATRDEELQYPPRKKKVRRINFFDHNRESPHRKKTLKVGYVRDRTMRDRTQKIVNRNDIRNFARRVSLFGPALQGLRQQRSRILDVDLYPQKIPKRNLKNNFFEDSQQVQGPSGFEEFEARVSAGFQPKKRRKKVIQSQIFDNNQQKIKRRKKRRKINSKIPSRRKVKKKKIGTVKIESKIKSPRHLQQRSQSLLT